MRNVAFTKEKRTTNGEMRNPKPGLQSSGKIEWKVTNLVNLKFYERKFFGTFQFSRAQHVRYSGATRHLTNTTRSFPWEPDLQLTTKTSYLDTVHHYV